MNQTPATSPTLLVRIRDSKDHQAWNQFIDIYAPLIHAYLRKRGLQEADAADLTQDVMQVIARRSKDFSYDPARGSFRDWLLTITLNRLRDFVGKKGRGANASGKTSIQQVLKEIPDRESEDLWNQQHQACLFQWAPDKAKVDFRDATWSAFWQTAVEDKPVKEVAAALDISSGAVHIAKSRVLARIREILKEIDD